MATRTSHLRTLGPYLIGESARENGEWDMFCPLHEDNKRSASLNTHSSEWFCQAGCGGGSVVELISRKGEWVPPPDDRVMSRAKRYISGAKSGSSEEDLPSEEEVQGMASSLLSNEDRMGWLLDVRLLTTDIIARYEIGWDSDQSVYTIPIRDHDGSLVNIRKYDPNPRDARRKIWGLTGHNEVRLWPLDQLDADEIFVLEGEWDSLLLISQGIPAVTRTGSAMVWHTSWSPLFKGKKVYTCHDADTDGQRGALKVIRSVGKYAECQNVNLPYPIEPKHGKDVTDFFHEYSLSDFHLLYQSPAPLLPLPEINGNGHVNGYELVKVIESGRAEFIGKAVKIALTVTSKREPCHTVPKRTQLSCDKSAGNKCNYCPIFTTENGQAEFEYLPEDSSILDFVGTSKAYMDSKLLSAYRIPGGKCPVAEVEVLEHQSIESLGGRQSLGNAGGIEASDYETAKIFSAGRNDTKPNSSVIFTGATVPHPKTQETVFLAWETEPQETSIDRFDITPDVIRDLSVFCPEPGQRPIEKVVEIAQELGKTVTHIYGRPQMHALMDMVWHSVVGWYFEGELVTRGWLEAIVIGDTQQGKSEAARRLARHYQAGEIVNCEAASFAGVVGGLQSIGDQWNITWGAVPINSGRLVIMEEASGLTQEQISQMSDIRSSGVARITKIITQETVARTRLLWLSNPRKRKMADFMYGVQAIRPLVGNDEDIARFDLAMSVAAGDVDVIKMNESGRRGEPRYTSDTCAALVRWVWSRRPEHVIWMPGAEDEVRRQAVSMVSRYVDNPPLVQAANVRFKIARLAIAIAARTFSSDDEGEHLLVSIAHVKDAVHFMDALYGMKGFGYRELSIAALRAKDIARDNYDDIKRYLAEENMAGLYEFLMMQPRFRRQDLEEVLNVDRQLANQVVNRLLSTRMVYKEGANICVGETLHRVLRELSRGRL